MLLQLCSSRSAEVSNCLITSRAAELPSEKVEPPCLYHRCGQELHASPHKEHTPILSYPYIDMWATMKF